MPSGSKIEYSICIPVYNSQSVLEELYRRIVRVFEQTGKRFEIIFVDDSSPDDSWSVLERLQTTDPRVTAIQLARNFGQHSALMCALHFAQGEFVLTLDDDLQHPPEEIPKLLATADQGFDVVYGEFPRKQHGWLRNFFSRFVNSVVGRMTEKNYTITSFRLLRQTIVRRVVTFTNCHPHVDVFISHVVAQRKIGQVLVHHDSSKRGSSGYTFRKLVLYSFDMIFNYTVVPLRIGSILGGIISLSSVVLGIYYLVLYLQHRVTVVGWTSLVLLLSFFSGVILFVLGIIGEYIGRIFLSVNNKPQYIIATTREGATKRNTL